MTPAHPDTLAALTSGIQSEVAAYVFYLEASKKPSAAPHKQTLEKLALEEKEHFFVLERKYDALVRSEKWISTADVLKQEGLPEIGEDMAQEHKALIDEVAGAESLMTILEIALRLETEARELFEEAATKMDSAEGKKMFERLANFEAGHEKLIQRMIDEARG